LRVATFYDLTGIPIERALTFDFLSESRNLVLVGRNGLGKTMIAQNICHAAVLAGSSVLFRSAPSLLEDLHRQTPEGRRRKLRSYANFGLLCVDEVGYLAFDDKAADLLYEVINRRYERKPVILTTNRPFKEWNEVFPNATCIVTMLDRLLRHADFTVIDGNSYRVRESELETAARRRKNDCGRARIRSRSLILLGHKMCWPNRGISWKRGHMVRRNSAGGGRLSSHLDGGRAPMSNSCCVQASASVALPAPIGEEQTRTVAGSVLSVRRGE
jgi:hypothetical protein